MNIKGSILYFLKMSLKSFFRDFNVHMQSVFSLYILLISILSLVFLVYNLKFGLIKQKEKQHISVFLKTSSNEKAAKNLAEDICKDKNIDTCFIQKPKQAKEIFLKKNPNLNRTLEKLDKSPFGYSIEIDLKKNVFSPKNIKNLIENYENLKSVDEVVSDTSLVEQWWKVIRLMNAMLFFMLCFSIIAFAILNSQNSLLLTFMEQNTIEVLSLIGATDAMISIRYIFSAIINSLLAFICALLSFKVLQNVLQELLRESFDMPWLQLHFFSRTFVFVLFCVLIVAAFLASVLGTRRFLK